ERPGPPCHRPDHHCLGRARLRHLHQDPGQALYPRALRIRLSRQLHRTVPGGYYQPAGGVALDRLRQHHPPMVEQRLRSGAGALERTGTRRSRLHPDCAVPVPGLAELVRRTIPRVVPLDNFM
ncbi:MAG: hypothetical protein, partial [Olavius algarvensis Gamma 1 endosymbiont]